MLPLAEYDINNRVRDILGDRNAVEVMTGHMSRTAADLVLHSDVNLRDSVYLRMHVERASTVTSWPCRWVSYMKSVVMSK